MKEVAHKSSNILHHFHHHHQAYYIEFCISNKAKLQRTTLCTKSIISPCISTYINFTLSYQTYNSAIEYLALFPSFFNQPHSLSRTTILQKATADHPFVIQSTNQKLDPTRHHEEQKPKPHS